MASPTAIQHGSYYHIYNRGNNRENLFVEEQNYTYFLQKYFTHTLEVADTFVYCLLRNHFHFLVRIKTPDEICLKYRSIKPGLIFGNFFNAYAKAMNKAYNRSGSLFKNPFGRRPATSESYLVRLVVYIHQNPQKHGFVTDFRDWPHSSYPYFQKQRHSLLKTSEAISWFGGRENFEAAHRETADPP